MELYSPTRPEPPEAAMDPGQPDPTTNPPVSLDPIVLEASLEGPSTPHRH